MTLRERRSVITGLGIAAGVAVSSSISNAQEKPVDFVPARYAEDAWMDRLAGKHRAFIDTASPKGGADAMLYANNMLNAHTRAYGGSESDFALIVCLRHFSTPFGFNDSIWEKYGEDLDSMIKFPDPTTGKAPKINLLNTDERMMVANRGNTIDSLKARGVTFAICDNAAHVFSGVLASRGHGSAESIYEEMRASAIEDSIFVAAGVLAVTRAQEYGYSLLSTG